MTYTEAAPNHNNGTGPATIETAQDDPIQYTEYTAADPAMTHHTSHTTNPTHTTPHQATTPRITIDHTHDHPTDHQIIVHTGKDHTVQDHTTTQEIKKSHLRRSKKAQIEEPPTDYYGLDDDFTDSGEELESSN